MAEKAFLGKGWSFPPAFNSDLGEVEMVSEVEDINQSLYILLSTSLGERVMQPQFGANLRDYQFDGLNNTLIHFLKELVSNAILLYEPRITVDQIDVTAADSFDLIEGLIRISIDYTVISANTRSNFVFPFYLEEANKSL